MNDGDLGYRQIKLTHGLSAICLVVYCLQDSGVVRGCDRGWKEKTPVKIAPLRAHALG